MRIDDANNDHVSQILEIYKPFIIETTVTFENEVPSIPAFSERLQSYQEFFPWLVAEENGVVAGYAYASRYRERVAYQWVAECSIYMHPDYKGKGIAQKLYSALFDILRLQGTYRVYAVIGLPHGESVRFHEKMGFRYFATYKNTGYKLGRWRDTGWWELVLKEAGDEPKSPIRYSNLDREAVQDIFRKYSG